MGPEDRPTTEAIFATTPPVSRGRKAGGPTNNRTGISRQQGPSRRVRRPVLGSWPAHFPCCRRIFLIIVLVGRITDEFATARRSTIEARLLLIWSSGRVSLPEGPRP